MVAAGPSVEPSGSRHPGRWRDQVELNPSHLELDGLLLVAKLAETPLAAHAVVAALAELNVERLCAHNGLAIAEVLELVRKLREIRDFVNMRNTNFIFLVILNFHRKERRSSIHRIGILENHAIPTLTCQSP